jgi:hypothetical protein
MLLLLVYSMCHPLVETDQGSPEFVRNQNNKNNVPFACLQRASSIGRDRSRKFQVPKEPE